MWASLPLAAGLWAKAVSPRLSATDRGHSTARNLANNALTPATAASLIRASLQDSGTLHGHVEHVGRDHDAEDSFQFFILGISGDEPDLDRLRWAATEFQPQHISPEFRPPDLEMPAQRLVWAFDVKITAVVIFELPLDQKISLIAIVGFLKTHLKVFIARTGHGNTRKGEFRHCRSPVRIVRPRGLRRADSTIGSGVGSGEISQRASPMEAKPTFGQVGGNC